MKTILKMIGGIIFCVFAMATASEIPRDYAERMQEIEKGCYSAIDAMFARTRMAVINKEDLSESDWFRNPQMHGLQNFLADVRVEYSFDSFVLQPVAEKVDAYLKQKIRDEMAIVCDQGADIAGVRQFLVVAKILCELNDGINCQDLIRSVKAENRQKIDTLKQERDAQLKEAQLARENLLHEVAQKD